MQPADRGGQHALLVVDRDDHVDRRRGRRAGRDGGLGQAGDGVHGATIRPGRERRLRPPES